MEIKLFEVRDRATFIPVMAVRLLAEVDSQEFWLMRRCGYGAMDIDVAEASHTPLATVLLTKLAGGSTCDCDPYVWDTGRTMKVAHLYIQQSWNDLKSGDVLDVEFILKESVVPKVSERYSRG